MSGMIKKNFDVPDETRPIPKGRGKSVVGIDFVAALFMPSHRHNHHK
jgi:hypothetical protein